MKLFCLLLLISFSNIFAQPEEPLSIQCGQLYTREYCSKESPRCTWIEADVCKRRKRGKCIKKRTISVGCEPRESCDVNKIRNKRDRKALCLAFGSEYCKWSGNRCIALHEVTPSLPTWQASSLCWYASLNGVCNENVPGMTTHPGMLPCYAYSDYYDCKGVSPAYGNYTLYPYPGYRRPQEEIAPTQQQASSLSLPPGATDPISQANSLSLHAPLAGACKALAQGMTTHPEKLPFILREERGMKPSQGRNLTSG